MGKQLCHGGALLHRDKKVVTVVCALVVCFVRGSHAQVHQTFGKPQHSGDRRKGLNETN